MAHPRAADTALIWAVRRLSSAVREAIRELLLPVARGLPRPTADARLDASTKRELLAQARAAGRELRAKAAELVKKSAEWLAGAVARAAERVATHAARSLERLGLKPDKGKVPDLDPVTKAWADRARARIEAGVADQADRAARRLLDGVREDRDPSELVDDVNAHALSTDDRAAGAAGDEVATLNSRLVAAIAPAAGSPGYVWTSQGDDRVRPHHEELDGQEFTWESGGDPEDGHPGEAINCRCRAFPQLPDEGPDA